MASVPLYCNICPKRPDFSDISHLLTHVGSKGHLSHYFKAQVRSRQEPRVRQQLDTYDQWYAQNQIEKLLSQRMVLKETKETQDKPRAARRTASASTSSGNATKKNRRAQTSPSINAKIEEVIDPQLSKVHYPPPMDSSMASLELLLSDSHSTSDMASKHRAYMPRMRQPSTSPHIISPDAALRISLCSMRKKMGLDAEIDSDYERSPSRIPPEMTYPDPSAHTNFARLYSSSQPTSVLEHNPHGPANTNDLNVTSSILHEAGSAPSPILKGVQWPGMDIFDSASPEAQRKRNQKKNQSVMAQMELNSTAVEPMERIYWPEGGLKKERLITGNVESSPLKDESPKPKRQREVSDRPVLGDLSTNIPLAKRPRARKPAGRKSPAQKSLTRNTASGDAVLKDLSQRGPALLDPRASADLRSLHSRLDCADEDVDWRINAEDLGVGRNRCFTVYEDTDAEDGRKPTVQLPKRNNKIKHYPFLRIMHHNSAVANPHEPSSHNFGLPFTASHPYSSSWSHSGYSRSSATPKEPTGRFGHPSGLTYPVSTSSQENYCPNYDCEGQLDEEPARAMAGRKSQHYCSVSEAHPPHFFDLLPQQTEFGDLADARFYGSSFNPLNPSAQFQHSQHLQGPNSHIATETAASDRTNRRRKTSSNLKSDFK